LIALFNSDESISGPINLGNPNEFTMLELAEAVIKTTKSKSIIEHRELPKDDPKQRRPLIKKANEMDLEALLLENMHKAYKAQKAMYSHEHFSDQKELESFLKDGVAILDFLKKKRVVYFSSKNTYLAGIETLLYQELRPGVFFKGLIDIVLYNETVDKWYVIDLKTSTSGWSDYVKKDDTKIAQVLLYKEFFAKQFNIDIDKIEVVYYILKRKVPMEAEFASMQRRVQEFKPPSGKIKTGKAVSMMNRFVQETLDQAGNFFDKDFQATPSESSCRFCVFRNNPICPQGV
jgi:hypothetical protein